MKVFISIKRKEKPTERHGFLFRYRRIKFDIEKTLQGQRIIASIKIVATKIYLWMSVFSDNWIVKLKHKKSFNNFSPEIWSATAEKVIQTTESITKPGKLFPPQWILNKIMLTWKSRHYATIMRIRRFFLFLQDEKTRTDIFMKVKMLQVTCIMGTPQIYLSTTGEHKAPWQAHSGVSRKTFFSLLFGNHILLVDQNGIETEKAILRPTADGRQKVAILLNHSAGVGRRNRFPRINSGEIEKESESYLFPIRHALKSFVGMFSINNFMFSYWARFAGSIGKQFSEIMRRRVHCIGGDWNVKGATLVQNY